MIEFIGRAAGTVLLAIALAAFSGHDSRAKTITDSAGRTVEVPDQIAHVLAAGPPAAVILYTLAPDKLIGWTRELNAQEAEFVAPTYRGLPVVGRITGKEGKLTPDVVVALHPDAIIDVGTINSEYVELADRFQKQTGIPYVLIDGMLASSAETYRTLGAILGAAPRAEELAHYADATLKDVADQVAAVPQGARPRVYYGRGADGLETGTTGSINTEMLAAVGAINVVAEEGSEELTKVSVEEIAAWNPDVILTLDRRFAAKVVADPAWQGVKAVKDQHAYLAPALPWGWIDSPPSVNRLIGLKWLLAILYPQKAKTDLRGDTREFYRLFYQVDLTDQQLSTLLDGATSPVH